MLAAILAYVVVAVLATKLAYVRGSKNHNPNPSACAFLGIIWPLALAGWLVINGLRALGGWVFADTKHMKRRWAEQAAEKARKQTMRELYATDRDMLPAEDVAWIEQEIADKKAEKERRAREVEAAKSRPQALPGGWLSIPEDIYGGPHIGELSSLLDDLQRLNRDRERITYGGHWL